MRLLRSGAFDRIETPTAYLMLSARNLLIERARRKAREQCIALPYDEERDVPMQPEQTWRIEEADVRRIYRRRSEEPTSELQSLMRISYAVFCLKKKTLNNANHEKHQTNEY